MHIIRSQIAKSRFYLAIAVILASAFLPVLSSATAFAAVSDTVDNIDGKVSQWLYYRGIWACMGGNKPSDISKDDLLTGHWFPEGKKGFGYLGPSLDGANDNDGTVNCDDGSAIDRAAEDYFGFSDEVDMFCAIDDALDDMGEADAIKPSIGDADCERSDSFDIGHASGDKWRAALTDVLDESLKSSGGRPRFHLGDNPDAGAWYYWLGKRGIEVFCGNNTPISEGVDSNAGSSDDIVDVTSVDPSTGEKTEGINYHLANDDRDQGSKVDDVYYAKGSTDEAADRTCLEMAALTKDNADAYSIYVKAHPDENIPTDTDGTGDTDANLDPVCSAGALGWVFCPLVDFISTATTQIANLIEGQLIYPALLGSGSPEGEAIQAIWGVVLGIANGALAIAFLIVIFSQATSVGISAYGIKKMLPRVIAAALMMNLSFYICAAAVDIANIIGVSIKDIVSNGMGIIDGIPPSADVRNGATDAQTWSAAVVGILGLGLAVATGAIFLLFPIILSALMAVLTALLIIAARQVIVTLLIIVAPLAFLAWILPNTEQWFTKWRKLFVSMLLMFPLVMIIFYGSLLMSKLIMVTSSPGGDGDPEIMTNVIALAVLTVPLFSLPFIMKSAGGILDRLGVIVNNRNKGFIDRTRKKSQEMYNRGSYARGRGIRQQAKTEFRNKKFASRLSAAEGARTLGEAIGNKERELGRSLTAAETAGVTTQWSNARTARRLAGGVAGVRSDLAANARRGDNRLTGALLNNTAGQRVTGSPIVQAQSGALVRAAQAQEAKEFNERVSTILTSYERGGEAGADTKAGGHLEQQWHEAVGAGNQEQAAAVITRLSNLGGGGRDRVAKLVERTQVSDQKMRDAITKSVAQDNYGSLVGKRGDLAKGGYDASGVWSPAGNIAKVSSEQLATQDKLALKLHFADIPQVEAARIVNDPELRSKVTGAEELAILEAAANGQANPYPPTANDTA